MGQRDGSKTAAKPRKRTGGLLIDSAMPTHERLRHAHGAFEIGGDKRSGRIFRMLDSPLEQLKSENRISELHYEALRKLRMHWYLGNLAGAPGAVDLNRIVARGNGAAQSERELMHRQEFRQAMAQMMAVEREITNAVVLLELALAHAGSLLGYRSPYRARLAALDWLCSGADRLVTHWRYRQSPVTLCRRFDNGR
jgi:hypothetical protein